MFPSPPTEAALSGRWLARRSAVRWCLRVGLFGVVLLLSGCYGQEEVPVLRLESAVGSDDPETFEAVIGRSAVKRLQRQEALSNEDWRQLFSVYPTCEVMDKLPAMLGDYELLEDRVVFVPAFPLVAGQEYVARWIEPSVYVESSWRIPKSAAAETRLEKVYPSASEWPQNVLRVYLEFSASMSRYGAADNVRLVRSDGTVVDLPFVAPETSLWNHDSNRLTLLVDPGRTKRQVGPNRTLGPVLEVGERYRLEVRGEWEDGRRQPLGETYVKEFLVVSADRESPDPKQWTFSPPKEATGSLTLQAPDPVDRGSFEHLVAVVDQTGHRVPGRIKVEEGETRWSFLPAVPWRAGSYRVLVSRSLEDPSGNSIRRRFEERIGPVDITGPADSPDTALWVFDIGRSDETLAQR